LESTWLSIIFMTSTPWIKFFSFYYTLTTSISHILSQSTVKNADAVAERNDQGTTTMEKTNDGHGLNKEEKRSKGVSNSSNSNNSNFHLRTSTKASSPRPWRRRCLWGRRLLSLWPLSYWRQPHSSTRRETGASCERFVVSLYYYARLSIISTVQPPPDHRFFRTTYISTTHRHYVFQTGN